jgi:hypothetical protein
MRAHVIENGKIVNTIEVESLDLPGFSLVDASAGGQIGDGWVSGAPVPAPVEPAPLAPLSPRQFRQALTKLGFRQQVDTAIAASSDQDLKDWYEWTSEFQRDHPAVLAMAQQMGFTDAQLNAVWAYGATI